MNADWVKVQFGVVVVQHMQPLQWKPVWESEWVTYMCERKAVYNRCEKKLIHVKKINMRSKTEQNDDHFRASLQRHYGLYDVITET